MTVLGLETATDTCSVALAQDGHVEMELTLRRPRSHAEQLVPMIRDALRYSGCRREDLGAVAVSMGPGSYTGLRIGVSAAKGLAAAVGTRLVGVPTLEALAARAGHMVDPDDILLAALPSRRREVYAACFRASGDGVQAMREAAALDVDAVPAWLEGLDATRYWLLGPGAERLASVLTGVATPVRRIENTGPSASAVARLGWQRLLKNRTVDLRTFEPFYLKAFAAKKQHSAFEKLSF